MSMFKVSLLRREGLLLYGLNLDKVLKWFSIKLGRQFGQRNEIFMKNEDALCVILLGRCMGTC